MRSYFHLLKQGKKQEAYEVLREYNPLPAVTGRVCPHYCEDECARQFVDESTNIRQLERFLADSYLEAEPKTIEVNREEKIAVVGSGPAGISCAYFLRRKGYDVTIYEREEKAGGNLRSGIPAYRLPENILDKQLEYIEKMGIKLITGVNVGTDVSIDELRAKYDAVYFAIGTQNSARINIPGVDNDGVIGGPRLPEKLQKYRNRQEGCCCRRRQRGDRRGAYSIEMWAGNVQMVCLETGDESQRGKRSLSRHAKRALRFARDLGQSKGI